MKTTEHSEDTEVKDNIEDSSSPDEVVKSKGKSKLDGDINDVTDEDTKEDKSQVNLELILDVPVDLEIELGRKRVPLEQVLKLEAGSVLSLDKTADEPVDLYVNGTLIANGMLITVDEEDTLGFQVKNIISRTERIKSLE